MEIEFGAVIDNEIKEFIVKRVCRVDKISVIIMCLLFLIVNIIVALCYDLIFLIFVIVYPIILILSCAGGKPKEELVIPQNITINEEELKVTTKKICEIRNVKDIKVINDYGKFYTIIFYFPNKSGAFVCQKNAIVKGTIADFESMFQDYIKVVKTKSY